MIVSVFLAVLGVNVIIFAIIGEHIRTDAIRLFYAIQRSFAPGQRGRSMRRGYMPQGSSWRLALVAPALGLLFVLSSPAGRRYIVGRFALEIFSTLVERGLYSKVDPERAFRHIDDTCDRMLQWVDNGIV